METNLERYLQESHFAHKAVEPDPFGCAVQDWRNKKVLKARTIFEPKDMDRLKPIGEGKLSLSEFSQCGKTSVCVASSADASPYQSRPITGFSIPVPNENWEDYNRISLMVYPKATGFSNFYFHFAIQNQNTDGTVSTQDHADSLTPNEWNWVSWEIPHWRRDNVTALDCQLFAMGTPPEALPEVEVYYEDFQLEAVRADYALGWQLEDRIAFCHSGYALNADKIAVAQDISAEEFVLMNENNEIVFTGKVNAEKTELGEYKLLDFSAFDQPGLYSLKIADQKTEPFRISEIPYQTAAWKSLNFLYALRCGCDVPGVHSSCHHTSFTAHPETGALVRNNGGWHDAGDVSQFEICTTEIAHAVLELAEKVKETQPELSVRALEEAKWGLQWLLQTRFGDGYRVFGALYHTWRGDAFTVETLQKHEMPSSSVENTPFENWLSAAAEALAARLYAGEDPAFAAWCLRAAREDFAFAENGRAQGRYTKRWGPDAPSQLCGQGLIAAMELYKATGDGEYIEKAAKLAETVISCQQQEVPDWEIPVRGFFYEGPDHVYPMAYEHRGHEQCPVQGLAMLYRTAKDHPDAPKWKKALELYREYILTTAKYCAPYGLMCGYVYKEDAIHYDRITIPASWGPREKFYDELQKQVRSGIKLTKGIYLRRLPIAVQRRGFHATVLSKAKGVSAAAVALKDERLMQAARDQIEWVLGRNPFASSTMYGEGYHYHPLYVAFSPQLMGALPVGIETLAETDEPYWPVINNAVYKEIWGHTTAKFLWILADLY